MAAADYESALPVALEAVSIGEKLFKPQPALQLFPLYLLAAQVRPQRCRWQLRGVTHVAGRGTKHQQGKAGAARVSHRSGAFIRQQTAKLYAAAVGVLQANLGLRRAAQCERCLGLASMLAMKEPNLTTNTMRSQLSRLYGQLYALQVSHQCRTVR